MVMEFKSVTSQAEGRDKLSYRQLLTYLEHVGAGLQWSWPDIVYISTPKDESEWTVVTPGVYLVNCFTGWNLYGEHSQQVWDTLLGKEHTIQVTTTDDIINLGYVDSFSQHEIERVLICSHRPGFDPETKLELEVTMRFKEVPEVQSIYIDEYLNGKRFLILTSNITYDDALMDQLLFIEREIRLSHVEMTTSFVYIPRLLESADEIVSRDSKLIYQRDYDVILVGSLVASRTE